MERIYLDAAPVIYSVQGVVPYAETVDARLASVSVVRVTSELTRLECRVKPLREADAALLKDFDDYFAAVVAEMVPLTREVMEMATLIRARHRFKTPDAIHLAAAVVFGCDVFLTNDHRLDGFGEIKMEAIT